MRPSGEALRRLAIAAVSISLAALAAAVCALSYPSVRDLAAAAGVPAGLARVYPVACDALLVMAGCSVLALRGAGLFSKAYGWLCLIVLLGGLAAASAARADGVSVAGRPAAIAGAVIPWVLLLAGLGLLLVMLKHARLSRRTAEPPSGSAERGPEEPSAAEPSASQPSVAQSSVAQSSAAEVSLAFAVPPSRPALDPVTVPYAEQPAEPTELRRAHSSPTPPSD